MDLTAAPYGGARYPVEARTDERIFARFHDLPTVLVPPADWQIPFQALSEECGLPTDVAAVFAGTQEYFEEVLARRTER